MSEVNNTGYAELRGYVRNNWDLVLYDGSGTAVLTLAEADPRVTVQDSHPNLTYTVALAGSDADITTPQTFAGGRLVSGGTTVAPDEAFAEGDATLGAEADELTVTATFSLPGTA
jgi:hypothetical protein